MVLKLNDATIVLMLFKEEISHQEYFACVAETERKMQTVPLMYAWSIPYCHKKNQNAVSEKLPLNAASGRSHVA